MIDVFLKLKCTQMSQYWQLFQYKSFRLMLSYIFPSGFIKMCISNNGLPFLLCG